jgi:8-oxo-dGTP pyrophosphatase MutT (NUDIX family)|tara:strand:- start:1354 stop:1995 length:642 start_codon:yes stop_codon:yes gene_type:complete
MSQIYKVFFKNISFEIKPFSKIDSKLPCIIFFDSFNEFISSVYNVLINNESCQKRLVLKSHNVQNDWMSLTNNLRKFECIVAAGGIVENNSKEWLFIFRNAVWDLPKGKVEKNEKLEVAAEREISEECGLSEMRLDSFISTTHHMYYENGIIKLKETHWFLFYSSQSKNLKPQLEEGITNLKWVSSNDLKDVLSNSFFSIQELVKIYLLHHRV